MDWGLKDPPPQVCVLNEELGKKVFPSRCDERQYQCYENLEEGIENSANNHLAELLPDEFVICNQTNVYPVDI